jgi:hypothetical protein
MKIDFRLKDEELYFPGSDPADWLTRTKEVAMQDALAPATSRGRETEPERLSIVDFDEYGHPKDFSHDNVVTYINDLWSGKHAFPRCNTLAEAYQAIMEDETSCGGSIWEQSGTTGAQNLETSYTFFLWDGALLHTFGTLKHKK